MDHHTFRNEALQDWIMGSFRLNAVQVLLGAQVNRSVGYRVGCESAFLERATGEPFELRAGLDHACLSFFALKINLAVGMERRRGEVAADSFLPMQLAGAGVEAAGEAIIGDDVQFVAD